VGAACSLKHWYTSTHLQHHIPQDSKLQNISVSDPARPLSFSSWKKWGHFCLPA
jgi:hypothetical protein